MRYVLSILTDFSIFREHCYIYQTRIWYPRHAENRINFLSNQDVFFQFRQMVNLCRTDSHLYLGVFPQNGARGSK